MLPPDIVAKLHLCAMRDFGAARDSWFFWLSNSTRCVVIGLILELPELAYETVDFARKRIDRLRYRVVLLEDRLEKAKLIAVVGWFLIVVGVGGEWYAGIKIDVLSARVQECNDAKLAEVTDEAGSAKDSAKEARDAAKEAKDASGKSVAESSSAMTIATGARKEANSFDTRIVSATNTAIEAEQHLAEALRATANAEEELKRIRTPRSLINPSVLTDALKAFKTEYTFFGCFQDQESIELLMQIDKVLADAGWTRVKLPPQTSSVDIHLTIKDFTVPITTRFGVYVVAQSTKTAEALNAISPPMLPAYIRAAMALKAGLGSAAGIYPAQGDLANPLSVESGNSTSVFIIVGKKP
jgi:hypothetical protein